MIPAETSKADYFVGNRRYSGLIVRSTPQEPVALAVLLPDWRGQSPLAREHADFLASLGCTVLIADLYGDGFIPDSPDQVGPLVQRLLQHRSEGVEALAAAVDRLREESSRNIPIICLGYSAGGMVALDYGRSGARISGIILCSALLKTAEAGMSTKIFPSVLVLQGTQDQVSDVGVIADVIAERWTPRRTMCDSSFIPRPTTPLTIQKQATTPLLVSCILLSLLRGQSVPLQLSFQRSQHPRMAPNQRFKPTGHSLRSRPAA